MSKKNKNRHQYINEGIDKEEYERIHDISSKTNTRVLFKDSRDFSGKRYACPRGHELTGASRSDVRRTYFCPTCLREYKEEEIQKNQKNDSTSS